MRKLILMLSILPLIGGCAGFAERYQQVVAEREASEARRLEMKCLSLGFKTEDGVRSCIMNLKSQEELEGNLALSCRLNGGVALSGGKCLK